MMIRRRALTRVVGVLLLVVLVPYGFSRIASSWRRLTVYAGPATALEENQSLRIACYNIAHGRGQSESNWTGESKQKRNERLNDIAQLIKTIDADIVVLNEVDFDSSWSHSVNQAEYLADFAGYPHRVEQRNLDFRLVFWKWRFGNAILSRYPIRDSRVLNFPSYSLPETILAGKKRGVECTIDFRGKRIEIAGVHLSHRSEGIRVRSAQLVMPTTNPRLVAGDFNSTPAGFPQSVTDSNSGNAIDKIDESSEFQRRPVAPPKDQSEFTFHSAEPRSVIDWILASNDWKIMDYKVVSSLLSDHRPIVAEFQLEPDDSP